MSLPVGWTEAPLREVVDRLVDGSHNPPKAAVAGRPMLGARNVENGRVVFHEVRRIAEDDFRREHARTQVAPGDVLLTIVGAIGRSAVVPDVEPFTLQRSVAVMKPHCVEPAFLSAQLQAPSIQAWFQANAKGTAQRGIYLGALGELRVRVPPRAEQQRIIAKVGELTARRRQAKEVLDAVLPLLDQLRQSILDAAFRGDLGPRAARRPREPSKVMARVRQQHEALRAGRKQRAKGRPADRSALPRLPHGWTWERAEEVVEPGTVVTYGIVLPGKHVEAGVPYVRGQDIEDGQVLVNQLLRTTPELAEKHRRSELQAGDVLLCIIRHLKVALVPPGLDGANVTQGTVRLRPSEAIVGKFLAYYLSSTFAQSWMKARYFGLAMPRINVEDAREIPVPVPPIGEQHEIVAAIDAIEMRLTAARSQVVAATSEQARLAQALLAKAFRGELVLQDPDDEPASVLLERIRSPGWR